MDLQLITGKVTDLNIETGRANILLSSSGQAAVGTAAVGAAALGSFFTSSILATGAMGNREAVLFSFKIGGKQFAGCFESLSLQEGDEVDVVAETNPENVNEAIVYAVRIPEQRCYWTAPQMSAGHGLMKKICLSFPWFGVVISVPLYLCLIIAHSYIRNGSLNYLLDNWSNELIVIIGGGTLIYVSLAIGYYLLFVPKAKKATKVLTLLGFENAANIEVANESHKVMKQWEAENGKPFPKDDDEFKLYY